MLGWTLLLAQTRAKLPVNLTHFPHSFPTNPNTISIYVVKRISEFNWSEKEGRKAQSRLFPISNHPMESSFKQTNTRLIAVSLLRPLPIPLWLTVSLWLSIGLWLSIRLRLTVAVIPLLGLLSVAVVSLLRLLLRLRIYR